MYSCLVTKTSVTALVKPASSYQWFTFTSKKPIELPYRGIEVPLTKGMKFGVRRSADKKKIRLVLGDEVNRVFTLSLDTAKAIARACEALK